MNITFAKKALPKGGALALTVCDGAALGPLGESLNKRTKGVLKEAMKAAEFSGKKGQSVEIIAARGTSIDRIILFGLGKPGDFEANGLQTLGGRFVNANLGKTKMISLAVDLPKGVAMSEADVAANLAFGVTLGAYRFNKYHTKLKANEKPKLNKVAMLVDELAEARAAWKPMHHLSDGVILARDLVNEPANILNPKDFAARCKALGDLGVKVKVLGEKQMADLGMGSLMGVSRGSANEAQLIFMEWMNGPKDEKPVAIVGKGLTFDSGGISIKPSGGMEDMKGDMGGAAAVTGLMSVLAARDAKVNVVGVVAAVENMPDADAQRPGDIVTAMSGHTIEVINTDAEGRLVLADAMYYTATQYKPKKMVDLATLTGAIVIALGHDQAGLFTNSDMMAEELLAASKASGEGLWQMPLNDVHRKNVKSKFADLRNSTGRDAGSSCAAAFLEPFSNKVAWAHLDIAGTAFAAPHNPLCHSWGAGYGVRLLNQWLADNEEAE
ncbi:MAG: leucyl aminopeptidase [Alphaproteobacteria bacterium]|nr:MAG: leucyl aminopeptidase [Alphaproteobacteria bacterium]